MASFTSVGFDRSAVFPSCLNTSDHVVSVASAFPLLFARINVFTISSSFFLEKEGRSEEFGVQQTDLPAPSAQ